MNPLSRADLAAAYFALKSDLDLELERLPDVAAKRYLPPEIYEQRVQLQLADRERIERFRAAVESAG